MPTQGNSSPRPGSKPRCKSACLSLALWIPTARNCCGRPMAPPTSPRWCINPPPTAGLPRRILCPAMPMWCGRLKLPTTRDFRSLGPFSGVVMDSSDVAFEDDFETNQGWTVSGKVATDGGWTRGVPITDCDRGNPTNTPNGTSACYLTDNSNNGGDCNSDVDGATPF